MRRLGFRSSLAIVGLLLSITSMVLSADDQTKVCLTKHDIGRFVVPITNQGIIGGTQHYAGEQPLGLTYGYDCLTGEILRFGSEFPKGTNRGTFFQVTYWIGAVIGYDTLVSTGHCGSWTDGNRSDRAVELKPSAYPILSHPPFHSSEPDSVKIVSEQDFIATCTDTFPGISVDYVKKRPHKPLGVEVTQRSYAWSYGYAEDFVIFEVTVENIGSKYLRSFCVGLRQRGGTDYKPMGGQPDEIVGLLETYPSQFGCGYLDTVNVAWQTDNDGNPYEGEYISHVVNIGGSPYSSGRHVGGMFYLSVPSGRPYSYNWWTGRPDDFAPRHKEDFRNFQTGTFGLPFGDLNRYYMLTNQEIDYDQVMTSQITGLNPIWMTPPPAYADSISDGADTPISLISLPPLNLAPGNEYTFSFVVLAGENLHNDPTNAERNLPDRPLEYYANLDFSDLARNAMWAKWIYDNPGYDSDGDGYAGKYRVCVHDSVNTDSGWVATSADTQWYEGDGIPDWRAATPPHPPKVWIEPVVGGIRVRFNGSRTETERDALTQIVDFEGYNVWLGRDDRESSYSLVASYDNDNFDKFTWNPEAGSSGEFGTTGDFVLDDNPFTLEQLRCLYASGSDPCNNEQFHPRNYPRSSPYYNPNFPDSTFYFAPHHYNAPLDNSFGISKVYPDSKLPPPGLHPDSLGEDYYTNEGYLKYYEYEFIIENLLVTVPYYISVTAFDFGSPKQGLQPLETSRTEGAQHIFPLDSDAQLSGEKLKAYVYPNPYRLDGNYRAHGYEGRTREMLPDEKVRAIHFANLPAKCWIRVYSLDGDLIRELRHEYDKDDPNRFHAQWDLVNRNRQMIVSGLYYWVVEEDNGEVQMGKLAIIL